MISAWGRLNLIRNCDSIGERTWPEVAQVLDKLARPERLELPTTWFEARYSIQLSYGRIGHSVYLEVYPSALCRKMECTAYRKLSYGGLASQLGRFQPTHTERMGYLSKKRPCIENHKLPPADPIRSSDKRLRAQLMPVSVQWPIFRIDSLGQ